MMHKSTTSSPMVSSFFTLRKGLLQCGLFMALLLHTGSAVAGGSFLRGDANGDGAVDISDGIAILQYLFNCGEDCPMACDDAADYDDNGVIEMTDAINVFGFLFQGGAAPAAPYPVEGTDTTEDTLSCGNAPNIVEVAIGIEHSCARSDEGAVFCWGYGRDGALGRGRKYATESAACGSLLPVEVPLEFSVDQISTGESHSCARSNGEVWCWGSNSSGELGDSETDFGAWKKSYEPVSVDGITDATQLVSSAGFNCVLNGDGSVRCWGRNSFGQLGDGTTTDRNTPVTVDGLPPVASIALGSNHTCALTQDGVVYCWGRNAYGATGHGLYGGEDALVPGLVKGPHSNEGQLPLMTAIAAGSSHNCALSEDGAVWCWGYDRQGQCGDGEPLNDTPSVTFADLERRAVQVVGIPAMTSISVNRHYSCGITGDGTRHCWGADLGLPVPASSEAQIDDRLGDVISESNGGSHKCTVTVEEGLQCWGNNVKGQLGDNTTENRSEPGSVIFPQPVEDPWTNLSVSRDHNCALRSSGKIQCWGKDDTKTKDVPCRKTFTELSAGGNFTCGLDEQVIKVNALGEYYIECWGDYGQVWGTGIPLPLGPLSGLSSGYWHGCALTSEQTVVCFGSNSSEQATPPAGTFVSLSAGRKHTCGLDTEGSIQCWGDNEFGQATPPEGTFQSVSAGGYHTCGLNTEGSIQCWGNNDSGQTTPPEGSFQMVRAGGVHTCGINASDSIECWGDNEFGQSTPPEGSFQSVGTGEFHSCGMDTENNIQCWGKDNFDQSTSP